MKELCFSYGPSLVLDGLNGNLAAGRFHGLVGPNGCGKTTLLDLLVGHRRCDGGTVLFDGRPLDTYSKRALARRMALVPQE